MSQQNNVNNSLAHTKWNCKYHVVFAPKYRRKVFYGEKKEAIRDIIRTLCLVLCQEIVQDKKRKFYYPARTSFSLDWLARYNFSNSLGDKYPQ